jgi:flavin reductase (DIM6/NTAB) family NADH-FMN oxidoreductase RutF
MSVDLKAAAYTMIGLKPIPVAVTTIHDGRTNGLMSLSAGAAGIVPEAPRVTISITKFNFSHDLILNSGVFTIHVLSNGEELTEASLDIIRALGGPSGRDGDKLAGLRTKEGVTGAPILLDALTYVEARVTGSLDNDENTIFVGDVVAAEKLSSGGRMNVGEAWNGLGPEWAAAYDAGHEPQVNHCREMRGLSIPGA